MESVDVYWSFRSPYSYLATPGMRDLAKDFKVEVNLCTVLPAAVRAPEVLFTPQNLPRVRYIQLDWPRRARFLGMSDRWPNPDPIVQDMNTMEVAAEQPLIYRLSTLGIEAQRRGRGVEFAFEVSHLIFGGTRDWHLGDHLAQATERAGLDLADMERAIADGDHVAQIEANQDRMAALGQWGVPTFVFREEAFFGQDRIDTLRWHLEGVGLKR